MRIGSGEPRQALGASFLFFLNATWGPRGVLGSPSNPGWIRGWIPVGSRVGSWVVSLCMGTGDLGGSLAISEAIQGSLRLSAELQGSLRFSEHPSGSLTICEDLRRSLRVPNDLEGCRMHSNYFEGSALYSKMFGVLPIVWPRRLYDGSTHNCTYG